jgi:glycerol uptake facilitator protein
MIKKSLGELVGTFILVFIGCSSVAISTLGLGLSSLLEVALVWGTGVTLAIYSVRKICPAHFNPAVSLAEFMDKKITTSTLFSFVLFQLLGAFLAGCLVFLIFNNQLRAFEELIGITRGKPDSQLTARMFGEFFLIESNRSELTTILVSMFNEAKGTFILVFVILILGNTERKIGILAPIIIGITVTLLILWIASITQGGFNPARDFGPRLVAYFGGWKQAAFPQISYGFFTVYILAPLIGGIFATLTYWIYKLIYHKFISKTWINGD